MALIARDKRSAATGFRFDPRKAVETVATLLRLEPHRLMGRKRLLALLYLADRESLKRTGRPIIGGRLAALPFGPIHSEVYDLVKGGNSNQAEWSRHFHNETYFVLLADDPRIEALSRYEVNLLNEISKQFMGYDDWDVADETHKLPEYVKTYKRGMSAPIPLEQVIDAVGRTKDKDAILRDAREKAFFDHLFAERP